jgi:DNA-binding HxlR family transcriptional regulator
MFRTKVRNSAMGGTFGGIIFCSCAATARSYGGSRAPMRGVTISVTMEKKTTLRNPKRQSAARPGRAVRGSTTGRPLMAALDLLGRRWSLRILWELRDGPLGARSLRERCDGMSPSVLYDRLADLTGAGLVVQRDDQCYELSETGLSLGEALSPLDRWARRWAGGT